MDLKDYWIGFTPILVLMLYMLFVGDSSTPERTFMKLMFLFNVTAYAVLYAQIIIKSSGK